MEEMTLLVQKREATGKNVNRRLRAEGLVPAVVYGGGRDSVAIQVRQRKVEELLRKSGSDNAVFLLELEGTGKSRHTMIRELDLDPMNGNMVHIDFQRVDMSSEVRVEVSIEIQGVPEGVRTEGGLLDFVTREVEVSCLPDKIPASIELDVTELVIGQHVEASELTLPDEVELTSEPTQVIVSVKGKQQIDLGEEEEDEGLLTDEAAEPEVVGQGDE